MIPSSSSGLSGHSHIQRPPSSASQRPPSSTSQRPPSSTSHHRPPSSLSSRPMSSTSMRPHSRVSQRPNSRHARSRLIPACQTLVTQITGLKEKGGSEEDEEKFRTAVEFAVKNLEATTLNKGAAGVDMSLMDKQIHGHAQKARINSRDSLAEALETSYKQLTMHVVQETDLDQEIKMSRLPDHLQLLIKLSLPATRTTIAYADSYLHSLANPPQAPPALTWKDILAEEPFEGQHWEGVYGLPHGSVVGGRSNGSGSGSSTPSLSPLNSDDLELDMDDSFSSLEYEEEEISSPTPSQGPAVTANIQSKPPTTYAHRKEFEDLQAKQYWRPEWRSDADVSAKGGFDIGDASTLGPSLRRVLAQERMSLGALVIDAAEQERYINEQDAVREILMALQGRKNLMLTWADGTFAPTRATPRLMHLSLTSQSSILSSLARIVTTFHHLRAFTSSIFSKSQSSLSLKSHAQSAYNTRKSGITRTLEAFADAVDGEIRTLDAWCAGREEAMCRAQAGAGDGELVVSLLATEKAVRDRFEGSFGVLLDVVGRVFPPSEHAARSAYADTGTRIEAEGITWSLPTVPAAATTALLLDTLFEAVQEHLERGDDVSADALMRVFVKSAEPVWGMVGRWLKDGMGLGLGVGQGDRELDDEFFIEGSGLGVGMMGMGMGLLDPEFWADGYALRDGVIGENEGEENGTKMIPVFLKHVAELVLGSGKTTGLLRALGVPPAVDGQASLGDWRPFGDLLASEAQRRSVNAPTEQAKDGALFSVSIDTLSRLVYDELLPHCEATGKFLAKVLVDDCDLWQHLSAIEGLFLMRRGDAMSHFTDVLFAKMDSLKPWGDFHLLNTAFSDVIEANAGSTKEWIQTSLVRLSYRGSKDKDKTINRTVKAIDGLLVEYAIPFPLTYIFPPRILQVYGEIFVFLLQIRRAKSVLERILVRGQVLGARGLGSELKVFYAMRSRLSWFINTLLNFLTIYVIHTQVLKFHAAFREAKSIDEMIRIHGDHLEKVQGRCLLQTNTSALYRAILSILDMCLHFSDCFVAFAGDTTTHDISRHSISTNRHHRSRRQRRQRQNIIGFSQSLQEPQDSSDDDSDLDSSRDGNALQPPEPSFSMAASSVSSADDGFFSRIDKMSSELDGLVRFIRRGVESFAGGTGEAAPAFGVLAFALEDWDS